MATTLQFPPSKQPVSCHICGDTTDYKLNPSCKRCGKAYCINHTSKIDGLFCEQCMMAVSVEETTVQKVEEIYDEETDSLKTIKHKPATQYKPSGPDWTFATKKIAEISDEELKLQYQYHKAMVSLLEVELTTRLVKKQSGLRMIEHNGTTTVKRSTTVSQTTVRKQKKPLDLQALADQLKKAGITPEKLKELGLI